MKKFTLPIAPTDSNDVIFKNKEHDFAGMIKQYAEELKALNRSTENDFLSIGAGMNGVFSRATKISRTANSSVELITSDKVSEDTERLHSAFEMIKERLQYSELKLNNSSTVLQKMLDIGKNTNVPLDIFKRIVKHLRVLSVATKIENARLASSDNSFNILADDIEKLSVVIDSKTADIHKGLSLLQEEVRQVLYRMFSYKDSKNEITHAVLDSITADLQMLSEKRIQSSGVVQRLAIQSEQVSSDISEVVSSLQVHDITRQQIEHVTDIFDEVCLAATNEDSNGNVCIYAIRDIGELQIQQLENAKNEFISAVNRIIESLGGLTNRVLEMSEEVAKLNNVAGGGSTSFMSELGRSISTITTSFNKNKELDNELSDAVRSVSDTIRELSVFVNDIEEIGSEIELIAINAQIKAAHAGEKGAALSVLAEAIRTLSYSARGQTLAITAILKSISDAARELEKDGSGTDSENYGKTEDITGIMEGLHVSLDQTNHSLLLLLHSLEGETKDLSNAIGFLINSVTAHTRADEIISSITGGLQELVAYARETLPCNGEGVEMDYIKQLVSKYTMHQERQIHRSYFGQDVPGKPCLSKKLEKHGVTAVDSKDFGDNVELF
ncbi:MAG: methyl-accepting chemotaxis protein [Proteobacteria bacterium]|nr:methyl-accepting chemotaxis protein [Pseudomonadota bacterium]